jgi:hypothetical protein
MLPALAFIFSSVFKEPWLETLAVGVTPERWCLPQGFSRCVPAPWGELELYRRTP